VAAGCVGSGDLPRHRLDRAQGQDGETFRANTRTVGGHCLLEDRGGSGNRQVSGLGVDIAGWDAAARVLALVLCS
jgi:hypothetical protein